MNGVPIYCDKVTDRVQDFFVNNMVVDVNGKITKYGIFEVDKMEIILYNLKKYE